MNRQRELPLAREFRCGLLLVALVLSISDQVTKPRLPEPTCAAQQLHEDDVCPLHGMLRRHRQSFGYHSNLVMGARRLRVGVGFQNDLTQSLPDRKMWRNVVFSSLRNFRDRGSPRHSQ